MNVRVPEPGWIDVVHKRDCLELAASFEVAWVRGDGVDCHECAGFG